MGTWPMGWSIHLNSIHTSLQIATLSLTSSIWCSYWLHNLSLRRRTQVGAHAALEAGWSYLVRKSQGSYHLKHGIKGFGLAGSLPYRKRPSLGGLSNGQS